MRSQVLALFMMAALALAVSSQEPAPPVPSTSPNDGADCRALARPMTIPTLVQKKNGKDSFIRFPQLDDLVKLSFVACGRCDYTLVFGFVGDPNDPNFQWWGTTIDPGQDWRIFFDSVPEFMDGKNAFLDVICISDDFLSSSIDEVSFKFDNTNGSDGSAECAQHTKGDKHKGSPPTKDFITDFTKKAKSGQPFHVKAETTKKSPVFAVLIPGKAANGKRPLRFKPLPHTGKPMSAVEGNKTTWTFNFDTSGLASGNYEIHVRHAGKGDKQTWATATTQLTKK